NGWGSPDRGLGPPRPPRRRRRLRPPLVGADRDPGQAARRLAGRRRGQVLRVAQAVRQAQRAQRPCPPRRVARGLGEAGDPRLPRRVPPGRLSAAGVNQAPSRTPARPPPQLPPRPPFYPAVPPGASPPSRATGPGGPSH